jgi:hypothetical protein
MKVEVDQPANGQALICLLNLPKINWSLNASATLEKMSRD